MTQILWMWYYCWHIKTTLYILFSMCLNYANDCHHRFPISIKKHTWVVFRLFSGCSHSLTIPQPPLRRSFTCVGRQSLHFQMQTTIWSSQSLPCRAACALQKKKILREADFIYLNVFVCVYAYFIRYLSAGLISDTECSGNRVYPQCW